MKINIFIPNDEYIEKHRSISLLCSQFSTTAKVMGIFTLPEPEFSNL